MGFIETYHRVMDNADPRCKDWMFMSSPVWPVSLSLAYLFIVLVAGPKFMQNRSPYKLDTFTKYYNIYQVAACCYLVYGVLTNGWTTTYTLGCQLPDYSNSPEGIGMLNMVYLTFLVKLSELVETVVFVLRKKDRQISFLHVYHHVSTFLLAWVGVRFIGGGMATFPIMPNSIVHIVMYSYYLLSVSKNPTVRNSIQKIKPYITIMQMVQFCIIVVHAAQVFVPGCTMPRYVAYFYIPNVGLIFYLFYDFYKTNYTTTSSGTKKTKVAKAS